MPHPKKLIYRKAGWPLYYNVDLTISLGNESPGHYAGLDISLTSDFDFFRETNNLKMETFRKSVR